MKKSVSQRKNSLTKRWIFNNLMVIVLILLIIELAAVFAVQNYYYSSTQQYLTTRVNSIATNLSRYSQDTSTNFSTEIRGLVESFADKDKMELMVINSKGKIVLTSSGFSVDSSSPMPDYENIKDSLENIGYSVSRQPTTNEKVMAISYPISTINSEYSAVRVVTSLTQIDAAITNIIVVITVCCLVVILLVSFSGFYFMGTIVKPVGQISAATAKFAQGDFSMRLRDNSQGEISDLCIAINHMADELSSAESMKNEFISSVSHELRTPLTAIKGWAETINQDNDPQTMQKGMGIIISETERLAQMVEELLDFSRIQNGRFALHSENIDILAELGEAVLMYTERAKKENIEIIYNEPEMLPTVYGDKNRLKQVFINIIDNAIKYSDPEGGTVTIEATEQDGNIQIAIADTGCGIKATDLPKIKTKFFKANHTRRGSGIGLAVANEIVQLHGGRLDVMSEEGKGTTVAITLPPASVAAAAAEMIQA